MRRSMGKTAMGMGILVAAVMVDTRLNAGAINWSPAVDGDWNAGGNWVGGIVPGASDTPQSTNLANAIRVITDTAAVTGLNVAKGSVYVGANITATGTINVGLNSAGDGKLYQTAGTVSARNLYISNTGLPGYYEMTGGSIATTQSLSVGTSASVDGATTLGTLKIIGAGASSSNTIAVGTEFRIYNDAKLSVQIDASSEGVQQITCNAAVLNGLLDVGFAEGVTPRPGTWTLVTYNSFTASTFGFAPTVDTSKWSYSTTGNSTTAGALTVTYVPEPGSASLIAVPMLTLLNRRRRTRVQ